MQTGQQAHRHVHRQTGRQVLKVIAGNKDCFLCLGDAGVSGRRHTDRCADAGR